jgi:hypothetical protein
MMAETRPELELPPVVIVYFGEPWNGHPFSTEQVHLQRAETPVGQLCLDCQEPVAAGDRGLLHAVLRGGWLPGDPDGPRAEIEPLHIECQLRSLFSHDLRQCHHHYPDRSTREEALGTLAALNAERVGAGQGPWW